MELKILLWVHIVGELPRFRHDATLHDHLSLRNTTLTVPLSVLPRSFAISLSLSLSVISFRVTHAFVRVTRSGISPCCCCAILLERWARPPATIVAVAHHRRSVRHARTPGHSPDASVSEIACLPAMLPSRFARSLHPIDGIRYRSILATAPTGCVCACVCLMCVCVCIYALSKRLLHPMTVE